MIACSSIISPLGLSSRGDGNCTDGFENWMEVDPTWTHCYKQEQYANITWHDARENCTIKGGSLIVIKNETLMNAVIDNTIPVPTWLGMTNENPKGNISHISIIRTISADKFISFII